jgi:hypothetical protein
LFWLCATAVTIEVQREEGEESVHVEKVYFKRKDQITNCIEVGNDEGFDVPLEVLESSHLMYIVLKDEKEVTLQLTIFELKDDERLIVSI